MTTPHITAKEIFSGLGERLIRVLVADKGKIGFSSMTFPDTGVEAVIESGEKGSALLLRSGVTIPVALPYEELEQKIYRPSFRTDGPVLDLRHVTGEVTKAKPATANDSAEPKIGDMMPDGTIYAGISPDTNKPMYATPADAPLTMTFNKAKEYAATLDAHGHRDWRVPTKEELNMLFNNRVAIGGFNLTGFDSAGWYWSASQGSRWGAWGQRFGDGCADYNHRDNHSSVRCVR